MSFLVKSQTREITWDDFFGTERGATVFVGDAAELALQLAPVYSAVGLIADSFIACRWTLRKGDEGVSRPVAMPAWLVKPHSDVSVVDWRFQMVASLKLRGNAYGFITGPTPSIRPGGVVWLHPDQVSVFERKGELPQYQILGEAEPQYQYAHGGRIIHIRDFIVPGTVKGLSPIELFAKQMDSARWASEYGRNFFMNATRPAGLLRYKGARKLDEGETKTAKRLFKESTRGNDIATIGGDWEWQTLTITPNEAQFLSTIKANATIIASIFRVAPEDIGGESGNSRSYSNREMDQGVFNTRTLLPLAERVKAAFDPLLAADEFLDIDLSALSQPTGLEMARTDTERLRNGTRTLDALRRRDNLPPLTDDEIANWQQWYATNKSESESIAQTVAEQITKENV